MPRICLLLAPVALLLMGCELVGAGGGDRYTEDVQAKYALRAGGRLAVETFNGSVDISVWDKDEVEVLGKKSCESKQDLARMEMKADQAGNSLVLRVLRPERLRNCGVRMTIRVPRRTEIDQISTSNGAVRSEFGPATARNRWEGKLGTGGALLRLETSNGEIRLQKL